MKKWVVMVIICGLIALMFIPFGRALTFTETRTNRPTLHYIKLTEHTDFQIIFTHSIHLTDVIESYHVRPTNDFQLLSMEYSDVAIGMPPCRGWSNTNL